MKLSKCFIPTLKETPADAILPSHRLMLRAGMIRPLGAGIYSFLPLGYKVLTNALRIIRDEMNAIGGQEFHLPALNPIELWEETGRVKAFGDIMFHVKNRPLVLAPTHEEVICSIAKNHIRSYRDLPQIWYQIQTKFRNEPRPRSGVIRGRQFLMKDSYSLDATRSGLDASYDAHAEAYKKIFSRCDLKFFIVGASSGAMGGSASQEFMFESSAGEDTCAVCDSCGYAANIEVASSKVPGLVRESISREMEEIATPNVGTIDELMAFLKVDERLLAKSLVYMSDGKPILVLMSGNDQLNESKLTTVVGGDVRPIHPDELKSLTGADAGSIGPVGLKGLRILADMRLQHANNLISGANKNDVHIRNIDLNRDVKVEAYHDLRTVTTGEPCATCGTRLRIVNAIELGHVFKLGTKYSDAMQAAFLDEHGKEQPIIMGSYGIGVERILACHIEQHNDEAGIRWSKAMTPYHVHLILVSGKNEEIVRTVGGLYEELKKASFEVLYDDRQDVSPGFKFKDADLLGMPLQIIGGEKNLASGNIEVKDRRSGNRSIIPLDSVVQFVRDFYAS
jgi:prolyl-tRNA synthetase